MTYGVEDADVEQPDPKPGRERRSDSISGAMAGWFGVILAALSLAAFAAVSSFSSPDSLGYAALAGTAILSIGLIALIVLSHAVGMIEPTAALGLPRGSIRALLALGLAIVFVSVASWTLGGLFNPIGPLVTQVVVQKDELKAYWDRYPASDYIVKESEPPPSPAAKAPANPAGATAATGAKELKIYLRRAGSDQALLDLAKQILTISATVLVTIVGFYFGSNSSSDAARTVNAIMTGARDGQGGDAAAAERPPKSLDDLTRISSSIAAIASGCNSKLQGLGDDPVAVLREAVAGAGTENDLRLPAKLQEVEQLLADLKTTSSACAAEATRAKQIIESLAANTAQPQLQQAGERLQQLQAGVERDNHDFEEKFGRLADARNYILQKTAKG